MIAVTKTSHLYLDQFKFPNSIGNALFQQRPQYNTIPQEKKNESEKQILTRWCGDGGGDRDHGHGGGGGGALQMPLEQL